MMIPARFSRRFPLLLALSMASSAVCAQAVPDAGGILRDVAPSRPPEIRSGTGVSASPEAARAATAGGERVPVSQVRITGNTALAESELLALLPPLAGTSPTLDELNQAIARITAHYRAAGYPVARAYLPPPQKMEGGLLSIAVLEGKLAKIKTDNASRLDDSTVEALLSRSGRGQVVQSSAIDRPLLLLGDTPGVAAVDANLSAGSEVGETDLGVRLTPAPAWSGRIEADNHGGRYTGRNRLSLATDLNSPSGRGEWLSARVMASDEKLLYGRLAGQVPVGSDGWTLGAALGHTTYELGSIFSSLNAVGQATTAELFARYPIIRSVNANLYVQPGLEYRQLRDEIRSTATTTEKHAGVAAMHLSGDLRDGLLGGGIMRGNLSLLGGRLGFDNAQAAAIDAIAARTAGGYKKALIYLERQQYVADKLTLVGQIRAQWADGNLDSSEKFTLGGPYGVRAYATAEAPGDAGWVGTLELRYALAPWATLSVFHDAGAVRVNVNPFLTTPNSLHRRGNGLGLSGFYKDFDWRASIAWRQHETGTAEPDKNPRFWVQAGWRF